jgi:hypothetical protein
MKPIIKWVGGKTQLLNILIEKMQLDTVDYSNATYVEPFIGGGALFLYLVEQDVFKSYIINDINTRLINIYNTVKYDVDGLIQELDYLKNLYLNLNEEDRSILYYEKRKRFNEITITDYNIESASLFNTPEDVERIFNKVKEYYVLESVDVDLMELVMSEAIVEYTIMETMNTLNLIKYTKDDVRRMARKNISYK